MVTASNVTAVSGSYSDVNTAYSSAGISGLGDEAVTLSDSANVAQANSLDALTTGVVTATISTNDIGTLEDLTGTGNAYTITVADASVSAAKLNALDAKTTAAVTVSSSTVTGTVTEVTAAYNSAGITGLGEEAITISDTTSITVAQANALDALTSGVITATISTNDSDSLEDLTGTGNAYTITVADLSLIHI